MLVCTKKESAFLALRRWFRFSKCTYNHQVEVEEVRRRQALNQVHPQEKANRAFRNGGEPIEEDQKGVMKWLLSTITIIIRVMRETWINIFIFWRRLYAAFWFTRGDCRQSMDRTMLTLVLSSLLDPIGGISWQSLWIYGHHLTTGVFTMILSLASLSFLCCLVWF